MEDVKVLNHEPEQLLQDLISEFPQLKTESEIKINFFLKNLIDENKKNENSLSSESEGSVIKKSEELFQERGEYSGKEIAGIYFQGVQYFDFKNVYFINNTGIANLIDLLKSLLKQGVIIKFVNVREKIKHKFKSMGLECIFNCA